jgi:oligopeptide/dipeptide ABC transporter ATP-binding protein
MAEGRTNGTAAGSALTPEPLLQAVEVRKSYPLRRNAVGQVSETVRAVDGVDLSVARGTTVGVIGESGSGKTTLGRILSRLIPLDSGSIELGGVDIASFKGRQLKDLRTRLQIIFQDPFGALDPTKTVGHAVAEPLLIHGRIGRREMKASAARMLDTVGLSAGLVSRYPDQLSGGQRQRVCIARALILEPEVVIADEPTSALDLSTQSEILNLLLKLQEELGQSMVLISHDFATVRHLARRIAVMYMGRIVEEGPTAEVVNSPVHPYTEALLSAVPDPDPVVQRQRRRIVLTGEMPDASRLGRGCNFSSRCPLVTPECRDVDPVLNDVGADHRVACLVRAPGTSDPSHVVHQIGR